MEWLILEFASCGKNSNIPPSVCCPYSFFNAFGVNTVAPPVPVPTAAGDGVCCADVIHSSARCIAHI